MPSSDVVLFDLGGVVCRFEPEPRLARLAALCGLEPSEVRARVWESVLTRDFDVGRYTSAEWHAAVCERLGMALDFEAFEDVMLSALTPDASVLALVDAIERPRVRVAMLTDNPPLLLDALTRRFPSLLGRFDPMLFSCQLGYLKPSREAFEAALARLDVSPERVLFVDDTAANVEAGRVSGMRAVRFVDAETLRVDLATAGVLRA